MLNEAINLRQQRILLPLRRSQRLLLLQQISLLPQTVNGFILLCFMVPMPLYQPLLHVLLRSG